MAAPVFVVAAAVVLVGVTDGCTAGVLALADAAGAGEADFEGLGTAPDEPAFDDPEPLEVEALLDVLGTAALLVDGLADELVPT